MVYGFNCKEDVAAGSAQTRFMGRVTRSSLPNSWDRSVDWRLQIEKKRRRKRKKE